ncbi:glycosyltransferase [Alkalinema sp. FACHB-956]|uniref:glycosyltransferase n=1 Tax=Alkalinema sp. FACHB-956 TaxID=2692768 RepID=UPI00168730CA|nr:glycosyltransferase [Alkalinema sp. FACHB-956]MBD2329620.1 glycosyltransferase [Alkalinema sp. FACHB-956]
MNKPKFTFCIPNRNKIKYLPACIESMLAQTCQDWQCVFIDGNSDDGSWEYMQQFVHDPRFLLKRGLGQGMYADWNYSLEHVDTEYFYILTSDDICYPSLVDSTVNMLDQHPDVDICHFQYALIDQEGDMLYDPDEYVCNRFPIYAEVNRSPHRRSGLCEVFMHYMYGTIYMTITSLVFRRNLIAKMGGFSSQYGSVGDYDWSMRLGLFSDVIYLPQLLATWRLYPEQATALADGLQGSINYIEIAKKNLAALESSMNIRSVPKPLDFRKLLSKNLDQYIHERLLLAFSKPDPVHCAVNIYEICRTDSTYPFRKLLRRLRSVSYKAELTQSAGQLIEQYGLDWPPVNILDPASEIVPTQ